jgi:spore germination cell wall hydrolase CwlJ-like protein
VVGDPGDWDELTLLAATVFLEAEGEPAEGQLAVAHVVMNRIALWRLPDVHTVILGPDRRAWGDQRPFEVFSCWNDDYRQRAEARLAAARDQQSEPAWRAAAAAFWHYSSDPSNGATFYLREDLTRTIRGGTLPSWAADPHDPTKLNEQRITARIGRHVFLRG